MDKWKSRKFLVWLIWALFAVTSLIITKTVDTNIVIWFGTISVSYMGANAVSKIVQKEQL